MNKYGLAHVVDMDLSKCFDTLDHELIIKTPVRECFGEIDKLCLKEILKSLINKFAW